MYATVAARSFWQWVCWNDNVLYRFWIASFSLSVMVCLVKQAAAIRNASKHRWSLIEQLDHGWRCKVYCLLGTVDGALDQRPWACRFNPRLFCYVATLGKLFTHVPQFTKQYKIGTDQERWRSAAGKVTAGLADCNGRPLRSLQVTSLVGCLPRRSAPTVPKTVVYIYLLMNGRRDKVCWLHCLLQVWAAFCYCECSIDDCEIVCQVCWCKLLLVLCW